MTRLCVCILAFNLSASGALAQATGQLFTATKEQLDVAKVVLAQEDAWNHGDLTAYLSYYKDAPDTQAILGGPVRGLPAIRAAFRENFPSSTSMGTLEQSAVQVRELGDNFALAIGKYTLNRPHKDGGEATGSFTEVLERTPAGWKIIFSENT
jgi:uncharacterized protein (TIGR02246 family)